MNINYSIIDIETEKTNALLQTTTSDSVKNELKSIISELKRIKESNFEHFHKDVNWMKHEVPPKLGINAYFADTSNFHRLGCNFQLSGEPDRTRGHFNLIQSYILMVFD